MISVNDSLLDKNVTKRYLSLPQPCNQIQVTYVWVDGTGENLRCKTKTVESVPVRPSDCTIWSFDGTNTGQSENANNSDVLLYPCALFNDPFRRGQNKIVLCETYTSNKKPTATNSRSSCRKVMEQAKDCRPWFSMEQQYIIFGLDGRPLGWPRNDLPGEQGQGSGYCGIGTGTAVGRDVLESHYRACMYAGVKIAGSHAEVMPSQWEFQVGPCEGLDIGDNIWMARFLLQRIAEDYGIFVSFDPKPLPGKWNGCGLYTDFSTQKMRQDGGMREMEKAIDRLRQTHSKHILVYDRMDVVRENERRHSAPRPSAVEFSHGTANRETCVRIPRLVSDEGKGYLQDRRPLSNADPYKVAEILVRTICLSSSTTSCHQDSNRDVVLSKAPLDPIDV